MKKTVLVTGGAGFIGSNFIYLLLEERPEWKVVCVDALTYAANIHTLNDALKNPNFVFYKEDIRNREGIFKIFEIEHPDIVVNFAAESHVDRSIENPEVFLTTNIIGTAVLMDACRKYGMCYCSRTDGNIWILMDTIFRQAGVLAAKHQIGTIRIMGVGMALRPLGGKVEERAVICRKKRIQILIICYIKLAPIVKTGAL